MVGLVEVRVSKGMSDGGRHSGGGGSRLEDSGFCSGEATADTDLRWVPPGSSEDIIGESRLGRLMYSLIVGATRMVEVHGFSPLSLQISPNFLCHLSNKVWSNCRNTGLVQIVADLWPNRSSASAPMSIGSEELAAEDVTLGLGGGGGEWSGSGAGSSCVSLLFVLEI